MNQPGAGADDEGDVTLDAIVLGAGISGLVSASVALLQGATNVLVVDEYLSAGGNHLDRQCGEYTFDVGSFIFQDDSPLLRHFPELSSRYVAIDPTWGKLNPQGSVTTYPFSLRDDLLRAGPVELTRILLSAASSRLRRRRLRNARDFARYWIGARFAHRSGLENYIERFCGMPAEKIDLKFAQRRMLWIAEYASVSNLFFRVVKQRRRSSVSQPTNQQLARPREGFEYLYGPVVRRLEDGGVAFVFGADLLTLSKAAGVFRLEVGGRTYSAPRIVSTIPIDRTLDLLGKPPIQPLPVVELVSLFFSFSGQRNFAQSILYNFSHEGSWKRLTMYSDFYGKANLREYFTVEVIAGGSMSTIQSFADEFRRHTFKNGLFNGDLKLEGSHRLNSAYPIYTDGAGDRADRAVAELKALGVESFGRQGGFQYQPTARVSTIEAEAAMHAP